MPPLLPLLCEQFFSIQTQPKYLLLSMFLFAGVMYDSWSYISVDTFFSVDLELSSPLIFCKD